MDFKKKAGLALALAAIFTTGGANMALAADCVTAATPDGSGNAEVSGTNVTALNDSGANADAPVKVEVAAGTANVDMSDAGVALTVGSLTIEGETADVTEVTLPTAGATLAGTGGALAATADGRTLDVVAGGTLTLGDAAGSEGGFLNKLDVTDVFTVQGGDFAVKDTLKAAANIIVGKSTDTESVNFDVATLNATDGITFVIDPAYAVGRGNASIDGFATDVLDSPDDFAINVKLVAGENGTLTVGDNDHTWIDKAISVAATTGFNFNKWISDTNGGGILLNSDFGFGAAFGLNAPQTIMAGQGSIKVDGASTSSVPNPADANDFIAADQSLTVFNLTEVLDSSTAYDNTGDTAALAVINVTAGDTPFGNITVGTGTNVDATDAATIVLDNARGRADGTANKYVLFSNVTTANVSIGGETGAVNINDGLLANNKHWNYDENTMVFGSGLLKGKWSIENADGVAGDDLVLSVERDTNVAVRDVFGDLSNGMASLVDELYTDGQNNTALYDNDIKNNGTNNAGIAFVSRATDSFFIADRSQAAATLEGAAQIAVAGGVPYITSNIIGKISSLIVDHNNILNDTQPAYGNEPGQVGIWVTPFYSMGDVDGMDAGHFQNGFELNYGGAAFGLDYNVNEAFRLGVALNLGSGDTDSDEGDSDFSRTENDFDFFGGNIYGSWTNGAFGLTGDLGYTSVDNDITQRIPGALGLGGSLDSDVDSDAFTVGLTGKYRFAAGENLNIAPHLGLRYTQINIDDTTVRLTNGGRVFDTGTEDMNLFQIPLGVEFSGSTVTDGGWTVTPRADLGVLFTMGDTDVDTRARIAGTSINTGVMNADVIDSAAFTGTLGVKAAADNGLSLGLDYGILASGNQTDHQFSGMLRFEF